MTERTLDPAVQQRIFADAEKQVAAALSIVKATAPTGNGTNGNEFFNLNAEDHGMYLQVHFKDEKLISITFETEAGLRWEAARDAAIAEEEILWTDYT